MSKVRKQSREKFEASELFSDEDFDADEFVAQMDDTGPQQRAQARSGFRRLEEMREQKLLRRQLLELADFDDYDDFDDFDIR